MYGFQLVGRPTFADYVVHPVESCERNHDCALCKVFRVFVSVVLFVFSLGLVHRFCRAYLEARAIRRLSEQAQRQLRVTLFPLRSAQADVVSEGPVQRDVASLFKERLEASVREALAYLVANGCNKQSIQESMAQMLDDNYKAVLYLVVIDLARRHFSPGENSGLLFDGMPFDGQCGDGLVDVVTKCRALDEGKNEELCCCLTQNGTFPQGGDEAVKEVFTAVRNFECRSLQGKGLLLSNLGILQAAVEKA